LSTVATPLPAPPARVLELAQRAGTSKLLWWTGLAALDAADAGEQLGMLFDAEAARWRAVSRAAIAPRPAPARPACPG
jgi:hypothetical protein